MCWGVCCYWSCWLGACVSRFSEGVGVMEGSLPSKLNLWTSLVAQRLGVRLPVQGTRVRSLVREDLTCDGATGPVRHNCWARVPRAHMLCSGRSHLQWEARTPKQRPNTAKSKNKQISKFIKKKKKKSWISAETITLNYQMDFYPLTFNFRGKWSVKAVTAIWEKWFAHSSRSYKYWIFFLWKCSVLLETKINDYVFLFIVPVWDDEC